MVSEEPDLVSQLLAARRIWTEFPGKIRVETRIRANRSPWKLSSVVFKNGVEFRRKPFSPIHEVQDTGAVDWREMEKAQRAFAEKGVERHEEICWRIEADLERGDHSILAGRRLVAGIKSLRKPLIIGAAAALALAGVSLAFFLRPTKVELPRLPQPAPVPAVENLPPVDEPVVKEEPKPKSKSRVPAAAPKSTGREAGPVRMETIPKKAPLISEIYPEGYLLGRLQADDLAYVDTDASFSEIPDIYQNMSCIRTAFEDRTADVVPSFKLGGEARVYVAHDRRIRKKPEWLASSFSPTGDHITLYGPQGIGKFEMDLYVQERPAGWVQLGSNIEWRILTKKIRAVIPKELSMYVVCVAPR